MEARVALTPEAVEMLADRGLEIIVEQGAAQSIHYTDEAYARAGARLAQRPQTLLADMVIHLAPLPAADVNAMRRGAMLLTLADSGAYPADSIKALLSRGATAIALDRTRNSRGDLPLADIMAEVDGRAAIALATALLADPARGKGMLLGGIPGLIPCEVAIIGSGIGAIAAARSALGMGSVVRMLDNDIHSLRSASTALGPGVIGSSLHDRTLREALRTADVVVVASAPTHPLDRSGLTMKRGVVVIDISADPGMTFPTLKPAGWDTRAGDNHYYSRPGNAVPRTASMAISDTLTTMLDELLTASGATDALRLSPGLREATMALMGRAVDPDWARAAGQQPLNLSLFIEMS
jgi:alanine dehydrogenase